MQTTIAKAGKCCKFQTQNRCKLISGLSALTAEVEPLQGNEWLVQAEMARPSDFCSEFSFSSFNHGRKHQTAFFFKKNEKTVTAALVSPAHDWSIADVFTSITSPLIYIPSLNSVLPRHHPQTGVGNPK